MQGIIAAAPGCLGKRQHPVMQVYLAANPHKHVSLHATLMEEGK